MFIRDRLLSKSEPTHWLILQKFLGEDVFTILYIGPTDNKLPFNIKFQPVGSHLARLYRWSGLRCGGGATMAAPRRKPNSSSKIEVGCHRAISPCRV